MLQALDLNHDGVIEADEIAAASKSLLALDKNGDGQITADEMQPRQQGPQEMVQHFLAKFDTNKDGKISKAEAPEGMQKDFDAIDENHDGFLDRDELMQYFGTMGNQCGGQDGPGGPPNQN